MSNNTNKITTSNLTFYPTILTDILGNKIIELDSIVFSELIKNSKDSNSKNLTIDLSHYKHSISLTDDGDGMNLNDIKKNWFVVATNNKTNDSNTLGGKGIGRFSSFKICDKITIITKKSNSQELEFSISINNLKNLNKAEDLKIEIFQNNVPKHFSKNMTGTMIILEELHNLSLEELQIDLKNLILKNSKTKNDFSVNINFPASYKKINFIDSNDVTKLAPFKCKVSFQDNKILSYDCSIGLNNYIFKSIPISKTLSDKFLQLPKDLSLGKINLELNSFLLDNNFVKHYSIDKKKLQKEFLDYYYGISIYRNDFKIYGFGNNDWLDLNERRIDQPTKCINNKQIYGFIELDKSSSSLLEEKTSREGFIRSNYFTYLKNAVMLIIKQFESDILPYRKSLTGKNRTWIFDVATNNTSESNASTDNTSESNASTDNTSESNASTDNTSESNASTDNTSESNASTDNTSESNASTDNTSESNASTDNTSESNASTDNTSESNASTDNTSESNASTDNTSESNASTDNSNNIPLTSGSHSKSITPKFSNTVIIDSSFTISENAPEKIKRIVYELQKLNKQYINAQALLLRCLLDISTKYMSTINTQIKVTDNDLKGSILSTLTYMANNKLLDQKHISRIRTAVKKENIINYFNGVAHYYDYRPDYNTIKDIWNIFEPYIKICSEQK